MHSVAVEGDSFLEETAFPHYAAIPVYVSGNIRMDFSASSVSSLHIKAAELPTRTAGWSPPYTNKQDPRPFKITHAHSAMGEFDKPGRG